MATQTMEPLAITIDEAARRLGISRTTAYSRAKDGTLPVRRLGSRWLVSVKALEKMMDIEPRPAGELSDG